MPSILDLMGIKVTIQLKERPVNIRQLVEYLNKKKRTKISPTVSMVSMVLGIWFIEDESMILIESRV